VNPAEGASQFTVASVKVPHFLESMIMASARRSHCAMVAKSLSQWPSDFATIILLSRKCGTYVTCHQGVSVRYSYAVTGGGTQLSDHHPGSVRCF
jgi:hypothetical protein